MAYEIASKGILLLGIMASTFLFDPKGWKGTDGSGEGFNRTPENLRKFMD